jgi:hypothetical protein
MSERNYEYHEIHTCTLHLLHIEFESMDRVIVVRHRSAVREPDRLRHLEERCECQRWEGGESITYSATKPGQIPRSEI